LWERVGHLKRYPHVARLKHLEGKVVVRAVINAEGHLARAEVVQSSGYTVLDEDAIATLHRACPLHLAQPLGRTEVVVQVPINYRLQ
ncbi:MAG: energy transducer TonB, partial [Nitrospiraceae bacterium]